MSKNLIVDGLITTLDVKAHTGIFPKSKYEDDPLYSELKVLDRILSSLQ
jgi:hypothetical protein